MRQSTPLRFVLRPGLPNLRVRAEARTTGRIAYRSAHAQRTDRLPSSLTQIALILLCSLGICPRESTAQAQASLSGTVTDETGAVIAGATISIRHTSTNLERHTQTNSAGRYQVGALNVGLHRILVRAPGFSSQVLEDVALEVGRTAVHDFVLAVGDVAQEVIVAGTASIADRATFTAGHLIGRAAIATTPLNGQHFVDLALLAAGSVTPPQNGFLSQPLRGVGTFAINTAGHREDTTNFLVNGINLNDQANNYLLMQPTLGVIDEFRIDTSTPSAEYGRSSGAVVNIVTRSGTNEVRGSLFELFRDDALDARNFFSPRSGETAPFRRHQFGGHVGGAILRNRMFFLVAYEGARQDEALNVNSVVPSDEQRASVLDATIRRLLELLPRANVVDSGGTARFVGFAPAPVVVDQGALDVMETLPVGGSVHGFYALQSDDGVEPFMGGNTIPGFGHTRENRRQVLTLSHAQPIGSRSVNEARFGFNRLDNDSSPAALLNPAAFGIDTGIDRPTGLPQINVAGAFNFGGPMTVPLGRRDTTLVASDSFSHLRGSHAIKVGGEFRRVLNDYYQGTPGSFNFPSIAGFLAGTGNSFSIQTGDRSSYVTQDSLGLFAQNAYRWQSRLTLEVGLRYEWNVTPIERDNRFVVFDPVTASLLRIGVDSDAPVYRQNSRNLEPRAGVAWAGADGRTVLRGGYAVAVQQPTINVVVNLAANPPFGIPLTITGPVRLESAMQSARAAGLAPFSVQRDYRNATVRSWNVTMQRELVGNLSVTMSYVGARSTHLPIVLNINQPADGVRPFQALSTASPILPGASVGNIIETASSGRSTYDALWATVSRRLVNGLAVEASYTLSAAKDFNSLSSPPTRVSVQNSYNLQDSWGPADFDARHRLAVRTTYELPWRGNALIRGWRLAAILQSQSGNPVNILTNNSTVNGSANTLRPDIVGAIRMVRRPHLWFDTSTFAAVNRFGNLPRNAIVGPRFNNVDVSVAKTLAIGSARMLLRADVFNALNHPNFGQPGTVVGSPNFGRITNTRFPVGDAGSSRQIQLAATLEF